MNRLVKLLANDDGDLIERPKWCLVDNYDATDRTACTGEAFGSGESSARYETKEAERGITCENCKGRVRFFKSVKL